MLLKNTYIIYYNKTSLLLHEKHYLLSKILVKNEGDTNFKINIFLNSKYLLSNILVLSNSYKKFERKLGLKDSDTLEMEVFTNTPLGGSNYTDGFLEAQTTYRDFVCSQNNPCDLLKIQQRMSTKNIPTPVTVTLYYLIL